jgi:hypothetical protein
MLQSIVQRREPAALEEGANTHLVCNRLLRTVKLERDGSFSSVLLPVTDADKVDM